MHSVVRKTQSFCNACTPHGVNLLFTYNESGKYWFHLLWLWNKTWIHTTQSKTPSHQSKIFKKKTKKQTGVTGVYVASLPKQYNRDLAKVFEGIQVDLQDVALLEQAGRDNLINFANSGIGHIDYENYLAEVISASEPRLCVTRGYAFPQHSFHIHQLHQTELPNSSWYHSRHD